MANITCLKTGSNKSISVGTSYEVISENEKRYTIINDKGIEAKYCKTLFEKKRSRRAAREVQVEEVPVIPVRNVEELDIETNVNINGAITDVFINVTENNNEISSLRFSFRIGGSNISCGVYELSGIVDISARVDTIERNIRAYFDGNENIQLDQNFDFDELKKNIFEAIIQDACEQISRRSAFLLISTNQGSINDLYEEKLNEMSVSSTEWERNRNSGNDIKVWVLQTN